ncbi:MAG: ribbon-helix-helix domain-containing protein [bacterium]|nr:ribbon-helix-helix domain-containing protein [bacterium]
MIQTTVYLPDNLKQRLEKIAKAHNRTEASIIREAVEKALDNHDVSPTVPLFTQGWGDPTLAERIEELLAETGFGR